jgi:predicted ABC-type ATPase
MKIPCFVNADAIARGLNAFDLESEAVKAGRIMLDHLRELAARRKSFAFETTLAARTYAVWLAELKASGYAVHLFYYWLDRPELSIQRVAERVRAGGHFVPDETIRRRYSRSVRNFLELYRPVVTTWQVYDNTEKRGRLIAFNNGHFDTILDDDTWELFQRSATDGNPDDASGG